MTKTKVIQIGTLKIGGDNPISIQTMIKKPLKEIKRNLRDIQNLKNEGCDLIRIAYKDRKEALFIKTLVKESSLPVEVDIHFSSALAIEAINFGAPAIRVNPGNMRKDSLKEVIQLAKENKVAIRIGVNIGSVPAKYKRATDNVNAMINLTREFIEHFEENGFKELLISVKSDSVLETYQANIKIAELYNYPIHLGVTATGLGVPSIIKSSIGIGTLLLQGIGNTIRVSLTGSPLDEVRIAKTILSSLGLRKFGIEVISCPGCSRSQINVIKLANELQKELLSTRYSLLATRPIKVAVMGCEVNGPGEAAEAGLGIAGGKNCGVLFKRGEIISKVPENKIIKVLLYELKKMLKE